MTLHLSAPLSAAMIQQPRTPPTGQRQAIEVHIKWREVLDYKRELLRMMSIGTGWPVAKLDAVGCWPWAGAWGSCGCGASMGTMLCLPGFERSIQ